MTTCQMLVAVFQQLLETSAPAIALWGCTMVSIKSNRNLTLNVVTCAVKGGMVAHAVFAWVTKPSKPGDVKEGGSVRSFTELKDKELHESLVASHDSQNQGNLN